VIGAAGTPLLFNVREPLVKPESDAVILKVEPPVQFTVAMILLLAIVEVFAYSVLHGQMPLIDNLLALMANLMFLQIQMEILFYYHVHFV
jgi:hypothetical protein